MYFFDLSCCQKNKQTASHFFHSMRLHHRFSWDTDTIPTPHNSLFLPLLLSLPSCGSESPVTMVTTERWLQPFENHHASPATYRHTHTHAYTCCRYKVMAIIIHTGECSCEESAGSSLCPVTTTWPRSPLTTMKNTFGWKIPLLHIHIHTQSNLYSSGHFNLQIQTESPHCSHYHLINSISSTALWHFMIPFSVCML